MKSILLTIGITAFNEEQNIGNLLKSILSQEFDGYFLQEIIIISDGSTDKTVELIRSFKNDKILLKSDKNRLGKAARLNYIFKHAKGEAILLLDADVILATKNVISDLVHVLKSSDKIGLISGNAMPREGKTFIEKCVIASQEAYDDFRLNLREGNNPYCAEGRILMLSSTFAKGIVIPEKMFAIDNYLYFLTLTKGFKFNFVKSAIVLYRCPSTLRDQVRQNTRYVARNFKLESIFGDIVNTEYKVPKKIKYISLWRTFLKKPVYSISILFINLYCKFKARFEWKTINSKWKITLSTKTS